MWPDQCLCVCFCSGDRNSIGSLAFETARPADESGKFGDHRLSGARVWMHKRSRLQVFEREHSEIILTSATYLLSF